VKVATWRGGADFAIDEVPDPAPGPGQVVVRIDTVGVCGTDVHITQGLFPATPPAVLGHECSGVIAAAGEGVDRARVGERVTLNTTSHCGECEACRTWSESRCERLEKTSGMFAEYSVAPSQSAVRLPDGLDLELGALTEPASCCLSGVQMLDVPEAAVGVVIGGGIMGLFTLAFMKQAGVETAVMSEPVRSRREAAKQLGADVLHDPADCDVSELIDDLTGGYGAHLAAEAVGKPALVAKCVQIVRPRGQVLMIGVSPEGSPLPVDLYEMQYREVTLRGAFGRGNVFAQTPDAIAGLDLAGIISARYPLDDVAQAIADSGAGKGIKLVIRPNG
jgi:threonine dehydrogenase-like Zn-dependent dehydrogenase